MGAGEKIRDPMEGNGPQGMTGSLKLCSLRPGRIMGNDSKNMKSSREKAKLLNTFLASIFTQKGKK